MTFTLSINSIVVPRDSDRVVIGFDMGMAGARGEIPMTWEQARQIAADIAGAAEHARKNSLGSQHTTVILDTLHYDVRPPRQFGLEASTGNYHGHGKIIGG
jgi:hypothetical protein